MNEAGDGYMSFRIIFEKHRITLVGGNNEINVVLGNFTCKIASGEWKDFIRLGIIDKPDDTLIELANTFLHRCFKSRFQFAKLNAYAELIQNYDMALKEYPVCRKVISSKKTGNKPEIEDYYTIDSLSDLIFIEMLYAAEQNMHISRCKNCDKYYSSANAGADYCDRICKDNKTCKWVGAKKSYTRNLMADDALVLYEKVYQSLQYKKRRATTAEDTKQLSFALSVLRGARYKYKNKEISAIQFGEFLNKYK